MDKNNGNLKVEIYDLDVGTSVRFYHMENTMEIEGITYI